MSHTTTWRTAWKQLHRLNAPWKTTGEILTGKEAGKTFWGRDTYRWLPGETFLLHSWDIRMAEGRKRGIEVIGFDTEAREITAHSFDSNGSMARMVVDFRRDAYRLLGDAMRFDGRLVHRDTRIEGVWELKERARWVPWMEILLSRSPSHGIHDGEVPSRKFRREAP